MTAANEVLPQTRRRQSAPLWWVSPRQNPNTAKAGHQAAMIMAQCHVELACQIRNAMFALVDGGFSP